MADSPSKSVAVGKAAAKNDADTAAAALRLLSIVALLVAIVPVSTYFFTVKYVFGGAFRIRITFSKLSE
jgi:hypothetical protein